MRKWKYEMRYNYYWPEYYRWRVWGDLLWNATMNSIQSVRREITNFCCSWCFLDSFFNVNYVFKYNIEGFPGGAVVGSLPADAGDTGLSPVLGGSHMPRSDKAREPHLLSLCVWSLCSATREAAIVRGPRTAMRSGPHLPQLAGGPRTEMKTQHSHK